MQLHLNHVTEISFKRNATEPWNRISQVLSATLVPQATSIMQLESLSTSSHSTTRTGIPRRSSSHLTTREALQRCTPLAPRYECRTMREGMKEILAPLASTLVLCTLDCRHGTKNKIKTIDLELDSRHQLALITCCKTSHVDRTRTPTSPSSTIGIMARRTTRKPRFDDDDHLHVRTLL